MESPPLSLSLSLWHSLIHSILRVIKNVTECHWLKNWILLGKGKGLLQGLCSRLDRSCATLPWNPAPRALAHIPPIHPRCFCMETRSKTLHLVLFIQTLPLMTKFYHILISSSGSNSHGLKQTIKWLEHDQTLSNLKCFLFLIPSTRMLSLLLMEWEEGSNLGTNEFEISLNPCCDDRIASHPYLKLGLEIPTRTWS